MKIAILTEISTVSRNKLVETALSDRGHTIYNLGMHDPSEPELNYMHTATITGWLLNAGAVDLVVSGCGTGQGYAIMANRFPSVYCGHIVEPIDAFLFTQINNGNCISLQLNQGFGWAGEYKLSMIFDQLFAAAWGGGYPAERREAQKAIRAKLPEIADSCHANMLDIVCGMPEAFVQHCARTPGVLDLLNASKEKDSEWVRIINEIADM